MVKLSHHTFIVREGLYSDHRLLKSGLNLLNSNTSRRLPKPSFFILRFNTNSISNVLTISFLAWVFLWTCAHVILMLHRKDYMNIWIITPHQHILHFKVCALTTLHIRHFQSTRPTAGGPRCLAVASHTLITELSSWFLQIHPLLSEF